MNRPAFLLSLAFLAGIPGARAAIALVSDPPPATVEVGVEFGPLALRVTNAAGVPVAGATVRWPKNPNVTGIFTSDPPFTTCPFDPLAVCSKVTGPDGTVTLLPMYTASLGVQSLEFRAFLSAAPFTDLGSLRISVTVVPLSRPPSLSIVRGGGQSVVAGAAFPSPVSLQLRDFEGRPIAGQVVSFSCCPFDSQSSLRFASNTPSYSSFEARTDANGVVTTPPITAERGIGAGKLVATVSIPHTHGHLATYVPFTVTTTTGGTEVAIQDMWWSGINESGWGISIAQHDDRLFTVIYSYDATGRPTWRVMPSGRWLDGKRYWIWGSDLYTTRGTPYFAYDATRVVVEPQPRRSSLHFNGEDEGMLYVSSNAGQAEKHIQRQDFTDDANPAPLQGLADMWWGGPSQNGWGIAIMEQPGGLFSVWLTYDVDGAPIWFVMPTGRWTSQDTFEGTVFRTRGPTWPNYDKSQLEVIAVGTFRYRFHSRDSASFDFAVDGNAGTLSLVRQPF